MTGMAERRTNMVNSQILTNKVTDAALEEALRTVPKEAFLPKSMHPVAYLDCALEIAPGRYILEPMIFARMLQAAELTEDSMVLDVSCTTGYSTAVIAKIAGNVVGLEMDEALAEKANATLNEMGIDNAAVVTGDCAEGLESQGPYDVIFVNGAVGDVPDCWIEQLAEGGRIIGIQRGKGLGSAQCWIKTETGIGHTPLFDANCAHVPGLTPAQEFQF